MQHDKTYFNAVSSFIKSHETASIGTLHEAASRADIADSKGIGTLHEAASRADIAELRHRCIT